MVRKSTTKQIVGAGGDPTDGRDPAYQDLYVPRKEGDSTGSSQEVNDLASGLSAPGGENAAIAEAVKQQSGRPIALGESTKFINEANTTGITLGAGAGPPNEKPKVNLHDWVTGALAKYDSQILAELRENLGDIAPVVEDAKQEIQLTEDNRYPKYHA